MNGNPELRDGDVSFWFDQVGRPDLRAGLGADLQVDVCIVGAGYTGLWTAYYLKRADPTLRIAVLEQQFAGFGASGRNGGWLSSKLGGPYRRYEQLGDRAGTVALIRAMEAAVDEVVRVTQDEGIAADVAKDGRYVFARNDAQLLRARAAVAYEHSWGATEDDVRVVEGAELRTVTNVAGARAAIFSPHAARIHPARLVRGLAATVEKLGVKIYEGTRVDGLRPHAVRAAGGETVRAEYVLICTEGFTPHLARYRRSTLPMNSSMIVTAPLSDGQAAAVNWAGATVTGDLAHDYVYLQITADRRIAIGGRGVPYRYGSRFDASGRTPDATVRSLRTALVGMFPVLSEVAIERAWSGVLGVPRDWCVGVNVDHGTGVGAAGGYVGGGVCASNLAARTLTDLVLRRETELTRLPWAGHRSRSWEIEPVRCLGVAAMYAMYRRADRREADGLATTSRWGRVADRLSGR